MSTDPNKNSENSEDENASPVESLAERSARLEAEIASGAYTDKDPLAPEPLAESADGGSAETEALQNELNETRDKLLRAVAEAENTRRRAQKEREDAGKFAIAGFARDLLNVSDNLRRALEAVPADLVEADIRVKNLLDGIEATERELLRTFEKSGIQQINPKGETFDPNFHEVMFEAPGTGKPPGTIIEVLEVGYMLKERLLRPARVGVAKDDGGSSTPPEPPADPGGQIDTEV